MSIRLARFNIYLLAMVLIVSATGCRSSEKRREKQLATIRVHLELNRAAAVVSQIVSICRANPIPVNVMRDPILNEGNVTEAKIVTDSLGGFALQIQFDRRGAMLLEQYTALNPGQRLAIYSDFGDKLGEHRWLAAPLPSARVSTGTLIFTPDATRDEAEQIVLGLNNVAVKNGNREKPTKTRVKTE